MHTQAERLRQTGHSEHPTFEGIIRHIPEAIQIAKLEVASSGIAKTPEGTFAATYLLATRSLLRPVLNDLQTIGPDFLLPTGGAEYNPERSIDEIGTLVAERLAAQTHDIPGFWMRSEESARWQSNDGDGQTVQEGKHFAIIDPLDMTSSIQKKDRVQTTGIAIYDRDGNIKTVGIASLVDDGFVFLENDHGVIRQFPAGAESGHLSVEPLFQFEPSGNAKHTYIYARDDKIWFVLYDHIIDPHHFIAFYIDDLLIKEMDADR